MVAVPLGGMTAYAVTEKPEFSLSVSADSVNGGDNIVVTLIAKNETDKPITSFHGKFTYNSDIFRVAETETPDEMKTFIDGAEHQTVTVDKTSTSSGTFGFSFSDTTVSLLRPGMAKPFLVITLKTVGASGTGQITGVITSCYSDDYQFGMINMAQRALTVQTTTTTTTTAPVTVTQSNLSNDARLLALMVTSGELAPAFNPEFVAYNVSVTNDIASVRISATPMSDKAIVTGEGVKELAPGMNSFTVKVTAENGAVMNYGLLIYRAESVEGAAVLVDTVLSATDETVPTETEPSLWTTAMTTAAPAVVSIGDVGSDGKNSGTLAPPRDLGKLLLLIGGEIALFVFGFIAGYFIDKNLKQKALVEMQLEGVGQQMQQLSAAEMVPEYEEEYAEEYPRYEQQNIYGVTPTMYGQQIPGVDFGAIQYPEDDDYYN